MYKKDNMYIQNRVFFDLVTFQYGYTLRYFLIRQLLQICLNPMTTKIMPQKYKFHDCYISLWLVRYDDVAMVFSSMELAQSSCLYLRTLR